MQAFLCLHVITAEVLSGYEGTVAEIKAAKLPKKNAPQYTTGLHSLWIWPLELDDER